ncbi:CXD4 protein, partial [Nothocercus nigrocapillus]|nr:CXD4 protein [Nothocercus nigrocapillus]
MERWDLLGLLIITLNYNVTVVGKIWLMLTILLRLAVVVLAGYPLYQDEQERFICNTLQPGCSNVCYDLFSPVSHFRFWLFQTVSILLPYAAFNIYVLHKVAMHVVRMHGLAQGHKGIKCLPSPKDHKKHSASLVANRLDYDADSLSVLNFSEAYTVQLSVRTLIEAAFGAGQYYLFGFFVPERFSCYHSPCTSMVDCYISRPTEKSVMMIFMWAVSSLSFLLSLADLVCALRRMTVRKRQKKLLANLPVEDAHVSALPGQRASSSPAQRHDHPAPKDSQSSDGSCSLLSEEEGEPVLHPEVVSPQSASTNLNSNSNKPCALGDLAANHDSTAEPLCAADQQGTTCRQARPGLQQ